MTDTNSRVSDEAASGNQASAGFQSQPAENDSVASSLAANPAGQAPAEPRVAARKTISGRARVAVQGGAITHGRLADISVSGVGILMEDSIASKRICALECEVMIDGKRLSLRARAVAVYSVLVSGKGFRVGFQFGPLEPAAAKTVGEILA
jgi:hypothetical protein